MAVLTVKFAIALSGILAVLTLELERFAVASVSAGSSTITIGPRNMSPRRMRRFG